MSDTSADLIPECHKNVSRPLTQKMGGQSSSDEARIYTSRSSLVQDCIYALVVSRVYDAMFGSDA